MSQTKTRVAVVFGGRSGEHSISCITAGSVLASIDRDRYEVIPVGIAPDGRWVLESDDVDRLRIDDPKALPTVDPDRPSVALARGARGAALVIAEPGQVPDLLGEIDVAFPLLHGPWGEDGTIQGLFEMAGVRYVGAGVLASALAMDKAFMKIALAAADLPVMPSVAVTAQEWRREAPRVTNDANIIGYPLFVKPARGGSSLGITKVNKVGELRAAMTEAFEQDPKVLLEESAAPGSREIECGVLADAEGNLSASLPAEIRIGGDHEFYDFEAKYLPEQSTNLDVPADLSEELTTKIQEMSKAAFVAVGCEGLARVDFFLSNGELVINELNTMPGFTPTSMFPQMWAASGVDYPELVDRLLAAALARDTGLR